MEKDKELIVDGQKYIIVEDKKLVYAYRPFKYSLLTNPNFPVAQANDIETLKKKLKTKNKLNQFLWII